MLMIVLDRLYITVYLGSALIGLALSAVYPLLMSIPGAMGYYLSPTNAAMFTVMGSTGESVIPVLFGVMIDLFGPGVLFVGALLISVGMIVLYRGIMGYKSEGKEGSAL